MNSRTLFGAMLALLAFSGSAAAEIAVRGDIIYPMTGEPLENGVVLIAGDTIEEIGPAADITIPDDYQVLEAAVVTPGLVDAHNVVGLAGIYNTPHDQDQLDKTAPIQPALRALDAYNAREELVAWLRSLGITTVHTGPAPGALVSGQTMIVKTVGDTVAEATIDPVAMVAFSLNSSVENNFESPGTGSKGVSLLRQAFLDARAYGEKLEDDDKDVTPDLGKEVLLKVLNGELPALITAQTAVDIASALRLAKEFDLELILDGAADAYLVLEEIKAAGVPVILHPTMARPDGDMVNAAFNTAAKLEEAGIPFALQGGYESYVPKTRVILFEAAIAAANGLSKREALAAITIDAARIIGVDDQVGSLEPGKDADLVLFDGDPFEYTTHVCKVIVDGAVVSDVCR